jgi:hypothetical protein
VRKWRPLHREGEGNMAVRFVLHHIADNDAPTVASELNKLVMGGLCQVTSRYVEDLEPFKENSHPHPPSRYVNGRRDKGISSDELVEQIIYTAPEPVTMGEITEEMVAQGFAPTSASGTISRLKKDNKIIQLPNFRYAAVNKEEQGED